MARTRRRDRWWWWSLRHGLRVRLLDSCYVINVYRNQQKWITETKACNGWWWWWWVFNSSIRFKLNHKTISKEYIMVTVWLDSGKLWTCWLSWFISCRRILSCRRSIRMFAQPHAGWFDPWIIQKGTCPVRKFCDGLKILVLDNSHVIQCVRTKIRNILDPKTTHVWSLW